MLLRRWHWTLGLPFWTAIAAILIVLIVPSQYTAETTFLPQSRSDAQLPLGLNAIAGQLGLPLGGGGTSSPKFYADLITSETIMNQVLDQRLSSPLGQRDPPRLRQWLPIGGANLADSLYRARRYLRSHTDASLDRETGVVTLDVTLRDGRVAAAVASSFLDALNQFNTDRRQSQARERRKFVEQRISDAERELRAAEDTLRRFYETNRQFQNSPSLVFHERRLQARVNLLTEITLTLRREHESARIEEVNDTPLLTIVDAPAVPPRRSFPRRRTTVLSATAAALVIGLVVAVLTEYFEKTRLTDPDGRTAWLQAWSDFKSRWKRRREAESPRRV
jgi:uncharacterized protein involved in exopolysaccharide biosynthesis